MQVGLKLLKDSNPVKLVEYAVSIKTEEEPAFYWWVRDVLRRRKKRIISKLKSKYWRASHKFGIRLPKDVTEALQIDKETGMDFWAKAIEKELRHVRVAWESREDLDIDKVCTGKELIGHTEIVCHMVYDVKMDSTHKARFVVGIHMTKAPDTLHTQARSLEILSGLPFCWQSWMDLMSWPVTLEMCTSMHHARK